ncbi:MAG: type II toxin-antitoxin system HicA family toxin [Candidatus Pacebacteria bacterium]|nr:type II toxin-antitoxin system HicA family toxin [Candidatus Paceibacterota bacterium]
MPKLRILSGDDVCNSLVKEGFSILRQKGSHVRLVHRSSAVSYYVTVPLHTQIDRGTLRSIIRSIERCISKEKIEKMFYSE